MGLASMHATETDHAHQRPNDTGKYCPHHFTQHFIYLLLFFRNTGKKICYTHTLISYERTSPTQPTLLVWAAPRMHMLASNPPGQWYLSPYHGCFFKRTSVLVRIPSSLSHVHGSNNIWCLLSTWLLKSGNCSQDYPRPHPCSPGSLPSQIWKLWFNDLRF